MHENPELADSILWGLQVITIVDLLISKEDDDEFIKNWLNILVQCAESKRSKSEKRVPFISGIYLLRAAYAEPKDPFYAQLDRSLALRYGILSPEKEQEATQSLLELEQIAKELEPSNSFDAALPNMELQTTEGF